MYTKRKSWKRTINLLAEQVIQQWEWSLDPNGPSSLLDIETVIHENIKKKRENKETVKWHKRIRKRKRKTQGFHEHKSFCPEGHVQSQNDEKLRNLPSLFLHNPIWWFWHCPVRNHYLTNIIFPWMRSLVGKIQSSKQVFACALIQSLPGNLTMMTTEYLIEIAKEIPTVWPKYKNLPL